MSKKGTYKHFPWTTAHLRWVKANLSLTDEQMSKHLGCSRTCLAAFRKRMGLDKVSSYPKGNEPHNKGKEAPWAKSGACAKAHFTKGNRPHNANPPGTIRVESEHGKPRLMICVEGGRAKPYARWLWVKEKGPIPQGHIVRITNGVWDDVRIDNLQCVSRSENARLNLLKLVGEKRSSMMRKGWATRRKKDAQRVSQPYRIAA